MAGLHQLIKTGRSKPDDPLYQLDEKKARGREIIAAMR
jgi:hypothetical protein